MLPIGDDRGPNGPAPIVTWGLLALNIVVFLVELGQSSSGALELFIQSWGVVPQEYSLARDLPPLIPLPFWTTVITSMFLHGGLMHLGGNMLYLWVFGDNLERRLGRGRFLAFYLVCGIAAAVGHILFSWGSTVPTVGASGAISGILGGYMVLFPRNRVRVLTRGGVVAVPAVAMLGLWIVIQIVSQMSAGMSAEGGGVAYMAHIAGFAAGLVLAKILPGAKRKAYA